MCVLVSYRHGGLVKRMGLKISSMKAVNFDARLLPQPTAAFRDAANELKRGSWNVAPFVQPASNLVKYAIVDIFPHGVRVVKHLVLQFQTALISCLV